MLCIVKIHETSLGNEEGKIQAQAVYWVLFRIDIL